LLLFVAVLGSSGCLVPEGFVQPELNVAPRFALDTIAPKESLFEADPNCSCVNVRVTVFDDDDDRLLMRLATNVGRDNGDRTRCVREVIIGEAAQGRSIVQSIVPANELVGFPEENVHTISLYVTDAPAFAAPIDDPDVGKCGLVSADDAGVAPVVIEQRWAVRFIPDLAECYGCALTGGGL